MAAPSWLAAGEGRGSEFVVRLPLTDRAEPPSPRVPRRRPLGARAKVAVIEDNADSRELLCELLRQAGFDCQAAASGPAALDLVEAFRPVS